MKKCILLALSVTLMTACSGSGGGGDAPQTTVQKTVTIQGKSPQEYYNYFLATDQGRCGGYFSYLGSWSLLVHRRVNEHKIGVSLRIFLEADGSYYAEYDEDELIPEPGRSSHQMNPLVRETIVGRWSVSEDGILFLGQLGQGTSLMYNDRPSVNFVYGTFFAGREMAFDSVILGRITSNNGKRTDKRCSNRF